MARVVVIAAAQLSAERALMRDECPRPAARSKPASRTPRWRRPATARRGPLRRAHLGAPAVMRGSPLLLGRFASSGCWRGDPAVRQEQESRKSPDSVRFLGYL